MKKRLIMLLALVMTILVIVGCGDKKDNAKTEKVEKVYMIGTDVAYAPFSIKVDGKYVGIDIEILDEVAKAAGFKYELKPMNFNGIIPGITAGQLDGAIAGITITEKRAEVLDFSNSYYESGIIAVAKADNTAINTVEDFKNKKFAVKKGTQGSLFAEKFKKENNAELRYFDDSASMFQEVANGNADVTFEDFPVIAYKISLEEKPTLKLVGDKLSNSNFGFAVKKGDNSELLEKFNAGLKTIKENGTYDKILKKYQ